MKSLINKSERIKLLNFKLLFSRVFRNHFYNQQETHLRDTFRSYVGLDINLSK